MAWLDTLRWWTMDGPGQKRRTATQSRMKRLAVLRRVCELGAKGLKSPEDTEALLAFLFKMLGSMQLGVGALICMRTLLCVNPKP